MAKVQADKRARLIETAMKLAYKHGFRETSLGGHRRSRPCPGRQCLLLLQDEGRTRRGGSGAATDRVSGIPGGVGPVAFSEGAAVRICGKHSWEPGATCAWGMSAGRLVFRVTQGGRRSRKEIRGTLHRSNGLARGAIPGGRP